MTTIHNAADETDGRQMDAAIGISRQWIGRPKMTPTDLFLCCKQDANGRYVVVRKVEEEFATTYMRESAKLSKKRHG